MSKGDETTKASVRLPRLSIDVPHRFSPESDSERLAITIEAAPSFAAFASYLDAANPFAYWLNAMRVACLPWIALQRLAAPTPVPDAPLRAVGTDRGRSGDAEVAE
jgi:hypothetical protein